MATSVKMRRRLPSSLSQELIPDWVCTDDAAPPYSPTSPADMPACTPDMISLGYATTMRWSRYGGQAAVGHENEPIENIDGVDAIESEDIDSDDDTLHDHSHSTSSYLPYQDTMLPCLAPYSYSCPFQETCGCSYAPSEDIYSSNSSLPRFSGLRHNGSNIPSLSTLDEQLVRAPQEAFVELCYAEATGQDTSGTYRSRARALSDTDSTHTLHGRPEHVDTKGASSSGRDSSDCDSLLDPDFEVKARAVEPEAESPPRRKQICSLPRWLPEDPKLERDAQSKVVHVSFAPPEKERREVTMRQSTFCCSTTQGSGRADAIGSFPTRPHSEHNARSGMQRAFAGLRAAFTGR